MLAAVVALSAAAPVAQGNFVYWTSAAPNSSIARAKLNGSGVDQSFISGLNHPHGIATDARFIYWTQGDTTNGSIGRANLNGTLADQLFIPHAAGIGDPSAIAVTPSSIYWQHDGNEIGRANIDGTGVDPDFISTTNSACGLAADSNFLYFLNNGGTRIGRATLDGASIIPGFASIPEAFCGLSVDYNYLYWGSDSGNTVGAVPVVGGAADPDYIDAGTMGGGPSGVAVNSQFVFWGNYDTGAIARANLNGSASKVGLIPDAGVTGPADPSQVTAAPANKITVNFVVYHPKKGTATIQAKVPSPGVVTMDETNTAPDAGASAAAVQQVTMELPRAEVFELTVKPMGKTAAKLRKRVLKKGKGRATVGVFIHFVPATVAGVPNAEPVTVTLVRKGRRHKHRRK
jgi:virginiamycin B lyase